MTYPYIFSLLPQLSFENKAGRKRDSALVREEARLPAVQSSMLFDIFPFVMTYGPDMVIVNIGRSLMMVHFKSQAPTLSV